jgi:hypothetical protein
VLNRGLDRVTMNTASTVLTINGPSSSPETSGADAARPRSGPQHHPLSAPAHTRNRSVS